MFSLHLYRKLVNNFLHSHLELLFVCLPGRVIITLPPTGRFSPVSGWHTAYQPAYPLPTGGILFPTGFCFSDWLWVRTCGHRPASHVYFFNPSEVSTINLPATKFFGQATHDLKIFTVIHKRCGVARIAFHCRNTNQEFGYPLP